MKKGGTAPARGFAPEVEHRVNVVLKCKRVSQNSCWEASWACQSQTHGDACQCEKHGLLVK